MAVIKSGLNLMARYKTKVLDNSIHLMYAIYGIYMMIDIKVWSLGLQREKAMLLPTIYYIQ